LPRPIHEILPEGDWTAGYAGFLQGVTDYVHHKIQASFDDTEEAENERMTRLQFGRMFGGFPEPEKWSNRIGVSPGILLAVMEGLAQDCTSPIYHKRDERFVGRVPAMFFDDAAKIVKNKELKARDRLMYAVSLAVAMRSTAWLSQEDIPDYARDIAVKAVNLGQIWSGTAAGITKRGVADTTQNIMRLIPSEEELKEIEGTEKEKFSWNPEEENGEEAEGDEDKPEEGRGSPDTKDTDPIEKAERKKNEAVWGPLEIIKPPLTETRRLKEAFKANKFLRDTGKRIVRLNRALTDGKVFRGSRKKSQAGTILIDASGSMGLTAEMIETLVLGSPGTMVAFYEGADRGDSGGYVKVVAANGKVASAEQMRTYIGGNGVDGPALEWLGRQQGPRVWVSDGEVSGRNGFSWELKTSTQKIRTKHGIKWFDTRALGRSSAIVGPVIDALIRGTWKDGRDLGEDDR